MKRNNLRHPFQAIMAIVFLLMTACVCFLGDAYSANKKAYEYLTSNVTVSVSRQADGSFVLSPTHPKDGIIFYPGGRVDEVAYAPLLSKLAQDGHLCILLKMPFDLAILDPNGADGIIQNYPDIHSWYISGHSLGGVFAAAYASKHSTDFEGIILLASYVTKDLSKARLRVLTIYGSNDQILNMESYKANAVNQPADTTEIVISGGNHAGFAYYGPQQGDGKASISSDEQITRTVQAIHIFTDSSQ